MTLCKLGIAIISSFKIIKNYFIIFLKSSGENKLVKSIKLLPANIKSMDPMYPRIIELSACILNIFFFVILCPLIFLISLQTCSTPKLPK